MQLFQKSTKAKNYIRKHSPKESVSEQPLDGTITGKNMDSSKKSVTGITKKSHDHFVLFVHLSISQVLDNMDNMDSLDTTKIIVG